MSLILCPECGHECSVSAPSCPQCGHLFVIPKRVTPSVIVKEVPVREGFPAWVFIPIAVILGVLIFGIVYLIRENPDNANEQANIRLRETTNTNRQTGRTVTIAEPPVTVPKSSGTTVVVPPAATTTTREVTVAAPPVSTSANAATVKVEPTPGDKANVEVKATIVNKSGATLPVKKEKFYLLREDMNTILSKAGITPEDGDYTTTLGAVLTDPARRETLKEYLAAINPYIVASTLTDGAGKARFRDVKPDSYYLFGMTKTDDAVSVWNTSVTVTAGENSIDLNGQTTTSRSPTAY